MYKEYSRGEWPLLLAAGAAFITGLLVFILGYMLVRSIDAALYPAIILAAITFFPAHYLAKKRFPRDRLEMAFDDPTLGACIIDENDEDIPIFECETVESPGQTNMPGIDEAFAEIADLIEKEFNPQIIRDEAELKNDLFTFLSGNSPGRARKDVQVGDGTIDIMLDDAYGIRLAVVNDEGQLRNIVDEVAFYAESCKNVAVILFIDRLLAPKIDMEKFTEQLDQYGALVIIRQGMVG